MSEKVLFDWTWLSLNVISEMIVSFSPSLFKEMFQILKIQQVLKKKESEGICSKETSCGEKSVKMNLSQVSC